MLNLKPGILLLTLVPVGAVECKTIELIASLSETKPTSSRLKRVRVKIYMLLVCL